MLSKATITHTLWLSLLLLLAVACGGGENSAENGTDDTDEASNKLVIYSGRKESLIGPLIAQFEENTGIDVEIRYGETAAMAATILEEGENSPADVFYAQDPGGLGILSGDGYFATLPDDILAQVEPRFASPNKDWVGISGRARVIVYNTDNIAPEELPATLEGFTDPVWKGRIGIPPTNASFQAMITALRATWGEEKTRSWLEGIIANEPVYYAKNTPTVEAVGNGEVDIGFVNHYYLYRFIAAEGDSYPARNYFLPGGGPGSLIMVSGAAILNTAENRDNAETFIDYLLSVPGQQYFTAQTYEYPVILDDTVVVDSLLPPLADLNATAMDIDMTALADLEGTVSLMTELGMLD